MSDVADCQNVSDHAVAVAVDGLRVRLDVIQYHGTLKLSALVCVESYIVGILIEAQSRHIQFSCGAVGRLTVKPYQRLVLVCYFAFGSISGKGKSHHCRHGQ